MIVTANDRTELVATLYQAAMEPSLWQTALEQMARVLDAESGLILLMDKGGEPPVWLAGNSWSAKAHELYAAYYCTTDPLWAAHQSGAGDRVMLMQDFVPLENFDDREIWYDFARHHGGAYHAMVATVDLECGLQAALAVHRPRGAKPFDEQSRAGMADIARHGQAALRLRQRLNGNATGETVRDAVLDQLRHGVLVVESTGRLVYANHAAELLAVQAGARLSARSGLTMECQEATARLLSLVQKACSGQVGGLVRLPISRGNGGVAAKVAPLPVSSSYTMHRAAPAQGGLALITLSSLVTQVAPDLQSAAKMFGLTTAESALLPALLAGDTTEAIARARALSHHTFRSQVRSILAKTNAPSLRALSALFAAMLPP